MSIAGGLPRAVDRGYASGCESLQIFTKSAGQWRARALPPEEIALFRERVVETGIRPVVAHNSYLINVATAQPDLRAQPPALLEILPQLLRRDGAVALVEPCFQQVHRRLLLFRDAHRDPPCLSKAVVRRLRKVE